MATAGVASALLAGNKISEQQQQSLKSATTAAAAAAAAAAVEESCRFALQLQLQRQNSTNIIVQQPKKYMDIVLTIFVFRGHPIDTYYNRHVLLYCTSPDDATFHETVQLQRPTTTNTTTSKSSWQVGQLHREVDWMWDVSYVGHVNAGSVRVKNCMTPVDIVASTPTVGRDEEMSGWNGQHFLLEGLKGLVRYGLQTRDWYDFVEGELMEMVLDGAVP